jgi:hypothetical protein
VKAWRWWRHFKRGMERSSCVGAPVHWWCRERGG